MNIQKGDIFLANLEPVTGGEQGGIRPVLIIQNNLSNGNSPVTIIAAITSKIFTKEYPQNVVILKEDSRLNKDSTILLNQIRTIDKKRLIKRVGSVDFDYVRKVDLALKVSLGLA